MSAETAPDVGKGGGETKERKKQPGYEGRRRGWYPSNLCVYTS